MTSREAEFYANLIVTISAFGSLARDVLEAVEAGCLAAEEGC